MSLEFLTTEQAAELPQVSQLTIRRWCASGALPAVKLGREWRISRRRLDSIIQEQLDDGIAQTHPPHGEGFESE